MKIAIVNDAPLAVEALRRVVVGAGHEVLWIAVNGEEGVRLAAAERPELILMDLVMPVMDGVQCTRQIMAASPCPIVVVTSTVAGAYEKVYEAMALGALDAVDTPTIGDPASVERVVKKITTIGRLLAPAVRSPVSQLTRAPTAPPVATIAQAPLLAIGASTGGPRAVADVLAGIGPAFPAALVIVQHVDLQFASGLARWLEEQSKWRVELAEPGMRPRIGVALLAATEHHLVLTADGTLTYTPRPIEIPFRPSVDVFFKSAVAWKERAAAVLLTGMGKDGARGMLGLRAAGWLTIAQDEASSVVYGMPKAAVELKAATHVLALDAIAPVLTRHFRQPKRP